MHSWVTEFLNGSGYLGIAVLMLAENVFPPIPSEVIMPLAGFTAASGKLSLPLVIAAGTLGSVLGALPWYAVGRWLGNGRLKRFAERHGRWLTLGPAEVDRVQAAFDRHGGKTVFFGRMIPAVRTLVSVPAGVAHMPLPRFLAFTALGSLAWAGALAAAGHALGDDHARVARYLGPATTAVLAVIALVYVVRVVRWKPSR